MNADTLPDDPTGATSSAGIPVPTAATGVPVALAPIARLLLTPQEASAALGISPRLLWARTKIGEIPCIRIGKAVRYSPKALQRFIDQASDAK